MASRPAEGARTRGSLSATVNCYRFQCGLPVSRHDGEKLILLTGHSVDVIGMPAGLGERVLRGLRLAKLAGPVLARDGEWLFLCGPVGDSRPDLLRSLAGHGVYVISRRHAVILPPVLTGRQAGWVQPPLPRCTPAAWQAILATALRNLPAVGRPHSAAA